MEYRIAHPSKGGEVIIAQSTLEDGNMSFALGEQDQTIFNRRRFLQRLGLNLDNLIAAGLVHGSECAPVGIEDCGRGAYSLENAIPDTDALVTTGKNIILAVTTADCLPIFIWDEEQSVIGIAHAGWKGLAGGVVKNLLKKLRSLRPTNLYNLHVKIGVGIGRCCYTVDTDRLKRFAHLGFCHIYHREGEKVHLDLKAVARILLEREGIPASNLETASECSACGGKYPSYRRDGENFITDLALISLCDINV